MASRKKIIRLVEVLEMLADKDANYATTAKDEFVRGLNKGTSLGYRLAAKWIREDLLNEIVEVANVG